MNDTPTPETDAYIGPNNDDNMPDLTSKPLIELMKRIEYADLVVDEIIRRGIDPDVACPMVLSHPDAIVRGYAAGPDTVKATADHILSHGTKRHDTHDGIPI